MSVLSGLASSLGRRDEVPNQELAVRIVAENDQKSVLELVENLSNKNKSIQNDCIKVLYEIGEKKPDLIAGYHQEFITLLSSKNNRLQWGAMTALKTITKGNPDVVFQSLPKLVEVAEQATVITKDNLMAILIQLCSLEKYTNQAFTLFNEQLLKSATNQLPMYAENALPIINESNRLVFIQSLSSRLHEIEKESKRKRVEKVIQKLNKVR